MTLLHPNRPGSQPPQPPTVPATIPPDEVRPHRFDLEEYLRLSELGFFEGQRVEFIDGEILDMPAQRDSHVSGVTRARKWCDATFDEKLFWVRVQSTLRVGNSSPDPDVAVVDFPERPGNSYPPADRAVLVIEVSDSTLLADTTTKMSLYAGAGVRDYWVVSIPDRLLIVHRRPIRSAAARHGWAYADVRRYAPGEPVSPLAMPAAAVDPVQLLP